MEVANVLPENIDAIVFYDKPLLKFERLLETYLSFAPKGFMSFRKAMPLWLKEKLFLRDLLYKELKNCGFANLDYREILFSEHHLSHAASAFYPSPFESAGILVADGVGEWATTSIAAGSGNKITLKKEIHFPHSLGLLYSTFTQYCGFKVNSGEYKLMGLAPYGKPVYQNLIKDKLIDIKPDGSYALNLEYFEYPVGLKMVGRKFSELFGFPTRQKEGAMQQEYMDLAASIQAVTEDVMEKLAVNTIETSGSPNLCLAGGVALNCVANGKLLQKKIAKNIWVQPASGDAGGAIGAALAYYYSEDSENKIRKVDVLDGMNNCYLGNEYSASDVIEILNKSGAKFDEFEDERLLEKVAEILADGKAVGWYQGKMEFGPRALGNRSILADPRPPEMQKNLNLKIKFRESFRPFAPVVAEEFAADYFQMDQPSPHMMFTWNCINNSNNIPLPAITHLDNSARVQTVSALSNNKLHALLLEFKKKTGCAVLVNTSFNVRGEPIVESPEDAYHGFMSTGLDALVIGNCFMEKTKQNNPENYIPKVGED